MPANGVEAGSGEPVGELFLGKPHVAVVEFFAEEVHGVGLEVEDEEDAAPPRTWLEDAADFREDGAGSTV